MDVNVIFSGRDRNVLHALPAVLWLASCLYTSLSLLNALPPWVSDSAPLSLKNIIVIALCFLLVYPLYRLGYLWLQHLRPDASATRRIAALSLICVLLGATILVATLLSVDFSARPQGADPKWYLLNLFIGILLMPVFFFLVRGADSVREQITGARFGPVRQLLRRLGPDAGSRLIRLQSADHYVEVTTEAGTKLLLMRISDAIDMLSGTDGGRVHRSHWVNFDEVAGVVKKNRKIWLKMSDGAEVPVSRSYREPLRLAGVL